MSTEITHDDLQMFAEWPVGKEVRNCPACGDTAYREDIDVPLAMARLNAMSANGFTQELCCDPVARAERHASIAARIAALLPPTP